jgi:hypothetical protein
VSIWIGNWGRPNDQAAEGASYSEGRGEKFGHEDCRFEETDERNACGIEPVIRLTTT